MKETTIIEKKEAKGTLKLVFYGPPERNFTKSQAKQIDEEMDAVLEVAASMLEDNATIGEKI